MNKNPPMKALLAFEASVRLGSFLKAADELNVTAGAISQQIKKLEENLGVILFLREIRKLTVTEIGLKYYQMVVPALQQIHNAGQKIRHTARRHLSISMPPSLASKWFSPRMAKFLTQFPDIDLYLNATSSLVSFNSDEIDLAIRYCDQQDKQKDWILLSDDVCGVYCHPDYRVHNNIKRPEDLLRATLLHTTMHPYWATWLHHNSSLTHEQIDKLAGIYFDQTLLAVEAAKNQQGMLISHQVLVGNELTNNDLVMAFPIPYHSKKGFYLLQNKNYSSHKNITEIIQWLCDEFSLPV